MTAAFTDVWSDPALDFLITAESAADFTRRKWASANGDMQTESAKRWQVALRAFRAVGKRNGETQEIANAIYEADGKTPPIRNDKPAAPVDTVERLAKAYKMFYQLASLDCQRARKLRRIYGYSKWAVVWELKDEWEFQLDRAWDYMEYEGSITALVLHAENVESPAPEWERRANKLYREALKLSSDYGTPPPLQRAAKYFMKVFDAQFPKVTK